MLFIQILKLHCRRLTTMLALQSKKWIFKFGIIKQHPSQWFLRTNFRLPLLCFSVVSSFLISSDGWSQNHDWNNLKEVWNISLMTFQTNGPVGWSCRLDKNFKLTILNWFQKLKQKSYQKYKRLELAFNQQGYNSETKILTSKMKASFSKIF